MPYISGTISPTAPREVSPVLKNSAIIWKVKVEELDHIIELSSESKGECPRLTLQSQPHAIPAKWIT